LGTNLGMNPAKRRIEIPHHPAEGGRERRPPPDEHVVVAGAQPAGARGHRHSYDLPQPAAHAVTLHGIAYLSRHGKADADGTLVAARTCLQHEGAAGRPRAVRHCPKIAAAFQPLNDNSGTGVPIKH
jgi:hypothetical protein